LVRNSKTILNKSWESGHPGLICDVRGNGFCGEQIMRSLGELDISKARCSLASFPEMFICRPRLAQPWPQKMKMQNSCFSYVVYVKRSRNAGFSCYNVTPLPRTAAPPCLPLGIKDSLKEAFGFWLFGFWLLAFCCERLWKGKELLNGKGLLKENELLKGKCWRKIVEGKRIAKGKLLKGNC
jgi:hypothetical protein